MEFSVYWWTEGNGSCDCNRAIALNKHTEMYYRQRAQNPELKPWQQVCLGCNRFIAIDVKGDLEGYTKEEIIAAMNSEYPVNG